LFRKGFPPWRFQKKDLALQAQYAPFAVHAITSGAHAECANCGELKRPHHVCAACGHYDGREVVAAEA
jgi:large subunit ribosomal protein L32